MITLYGSLHIRLQWKDAVKQDALDVLISGRPKPITVEALTPLGHSTVQFHANIALVTSHGSGYLQFHT